MNSFKWEKRTGDYEAIEQIVKDMPLEVYIGGILVCVIGYQEGNFPLQANLVSNSAWKDKNSLGLRCWVLERGCEASH